MMQHASADPSPATPLARFSAVTAGLTQRYWRLVVVAMLALLHIAVVLAGLVGGKVYQRAGCGPRACCLVAFRSLVALRAGIILPETGRRREIAAESRRVAEYGLRLLFVLIALFPAERESTESAQVI